MTRPCLLLLGLLLAGCAAQQPAAFRPLSTLTLEQAMRSYPAATEQPAQLDDTSSGGRPRPTAVDAVYDYRPAALTKNTCTRLKRSVLMQQWEVTTTYLGSLPITKGPVIEKNQLVIVGSGPVATCQLTAALVAYTPGLAVMSAGLSCQGTPVCDWATTGHFNSRD